MSRTSPICGLINVCKPPTSPICGLVYGLFFYLSDTTQKHISLSPYQSVREEQADMLYNSRLIRAYYEQDY